MLHFFSPDGDQPDVAKSAASRGCCCPFMLPPKITSAKGWADVAPEMSHLFLYSKERKKAVILHRRSQLCRINGNGLGSSDSSAQVGTTQKRQYLGPVGVAAALPGFF